MNEAEFTKYHCKGLENLGCEVYPLVGGRLGKNSWPDRLIISKYGVWLLEFKSIKRKLEVAQRLVMERVNRVRNGTCYVVRQLQSDSGKPSKSGLLYLPHVEIEKQGVKLYFNNPRELFELLKNHEGI